MQPVQYACMFSILSIIIAYTKKDLEFQTNYMQGLRGVVSYDESCLILFVNY